MIAWLLTALALPLLIAVTLPFRETMALSTELLLVLVVVLAIAALGGVIVGTVAAIVASLLVNWFFVEPYSTLTIGDSRERRGARRVRRGCHHHRSAGRHRLATFPRGAPGPAGSRGVGPFDDEPHHRSRAGPTPDRADPLGVRARWRPARRGARRNLDTIAMAATVVGTPTATLSVPTGAVAATNTPRRSTGRSLSPDDHRLLQGARRPVGLGDREPDASSPRPPRPRRSPTSTPSEPRSCAAVSHDLRTPLASIKAMVSGCATRRWRGLRPSRRGPAHRRRGDRSPEPARRQPARCEPAADRTRCAVTSRPPSVGEVVAAAVHSIDAPSQSVVVDIPEDSSIVACDSTLLERSLANVIIERIAIQPAGHPGADRSGEVGATVHLRVIDHGIGIKPLDRTRVTAAVPTVRRQPTADGVGLGLSIAEGFVDAMEGTLHARRHAGRRSHGDDHLGG